MVHAKQKEKKIPASEFQKEEVQEIAKTLLGKYLFTHFDGILTGGMILETEAYNGADDKACHAYQNRRTKRTEVMFQDGGVAYVYLCYGMHHLFNIVTHKKDSPHAVLIRALKPTHGIDQMLTRRGKQKLDKTLCAGPGSLSKALGITTAHTGISLNGPDIWLEDHGVPIPPDAITASPRIGVDYAEEDALLPYRFQLENYSLFS